MHLGRESGPGSIAAVLALVAPGRGANGMDMLVGVNGVASQIFQQQRRRRFSQNLGRPPGKFGRRETSAFGIFWRPA